MVLVCPGCKNQITIDDSSVPEGIFKVRCTGCGKIITSQRETETATPSVSQSGITERKSVTPDQSVAPGIEAFVRREIASAKKEILDAMQALFRGAGISADAEENINAKRALICSGDPLTSQRLSSGAKNLGYVADTVVTAADSLKSLDTFYSMVIIDPSFGDEDAPKKLIGRVNIRKAVERRQMFLILISASQKTLDGNAAFLNGVNLILNKADLGTMENIIRQSQRDFQQMYASFYEVTRL